MAFFDNPGSRMIGIKAVVPENQITEEDFITEFGEENVKKFKKSTGIGSLYRALPEQTASDLGLAAAEGLLSDLKIEKGKIGILIFVTQSPDYRRPASACVLQKRLGLSTNCAALDVGLGCSGFVYGHQLMNSMMRNGDSEYGLLILGETASKLVNPGDKSIAMMYGDAGAAVLYKKDPCYLNRTLLKSDGSRFKSIVLPAGGFREMNPPHDEYECSDGIKRSKYDIYMDGISVFSFSTTDVPKAIQEYLERTETKTEDYDLFVFHQANRFILHQIGKKFCISKEKIPISLDRYGNTGGISIPLTLCDYFGKKRSEKAKVLASGFGIGLSWGVTSFELQSDYVYPIEKTKVCYPEGIIDLSKL